MERKDQLRNVAFGGAWSEQISEREALAAAIDMLDQAACNADETDPRHPNILDALDTATKNHAKAALLCSSWHRAGGRKDPSARVAELMGIVRLIRSAHR